MQSDLDNNHPNLDIDIFGINMTGTSAGAVYFPSSLSLPMVQDSSSLGIWNDWDAQWRDVYILNENNELVLVYNLTTNSLSDSNNYNDLMQHFIDATAP